MAETFSYPVRVYYEDTDAGAVVYYANYLKFMERARTELLRTRGFEQRQLMHEDGLVFAVVAAEIRYHRPARLDDRLEVTAVVTEHTRTSMTFEQSIFRGGLEGELLCGATIRAACLAFPSFRPRAIPERVLQELSRL